MIKKGRILAIDYGLKRIGVALSDESQFLASPLPVIISQKDLEKDAEAIQKLALEKQAILIVIGLPLHMDGNASELSTLSSKLGEILQQKWNLEVKMQDERLSSKMADHMLKEQGFSRKKRKERVDASAACVILQNYMDQQI
ncbi:MAG: Holliday junction resolvase RuvX [Chlamydiales bacterium]|nr:Holliday junction resolvase RuvX [Chlamydiales bacterium]NCF70813.1 Holliday junction resolvase RuvX [Chlamydiales bacterium]